MKHDDYTLGDDQPKKDLKDDRLGHAPFDRKFTAKVIKGIVTQSSSRDGIRYTYRKDTDEEL